MNYIIKHFDELSNKELLDIAKIRTEVFTIEQKVMESDIDDLDINAYHLFIYNREIIAYCRILKSGEAYKEASIGRVLVEKSNRKKGLARNLMIKAMDFIVNELNENKIKISAQEYIVPLYESLGFVIQGEVYDEVGIPHIKMIYNKQRL